MAGIGCRVQALVCSPLLLLGLVLLACGPAPTTPVAPSAPVAPPAAAAPGAPPSATEAPGRAPDVVTAGIVARNAYFWPVWIAEAMGFFTQQRIQNEVVLTRSPAGGHQMLVSGGADVALSTPETAILAAVKGAPLVLVAGGQEDPVYSLIVGPHIRTVEDLRKQPLAIAGLRDGVTLIMQRLLVSRGLREEDLEWIVVGGTTERYVAVKSGAAAAGLVGQPLDFQAETEGMRRLLSSSEVTREWQFINVATNREWARANEDVLVRWLRAYVNGARFLNDPANKEAAIRILAEATNTEERFARRTYELYFEELAGQVVSREAGINLNGLRNVIRLMEETGAFEGAPPPTPEQVVDLRYWERARQ
ncbi:MAG TPA: ABC transporter substrate-binding protein [Chloroflexota bacterium]|nr:ABC transporter substrate-binding protein [Chloroflexota bacterium]